MNWIIYATIAYGAAMFIVSLLLVINNIKWGRQLKKDGKIIDELIKKICE